MPNRLNKITRVHDSLKLNIPIKEYNKIIDKLKDETNSDAEVLAHIAEDMQLSPQDRFFAIAAMGEIK